MYEPPLPCKWWEAKLTPRSMLGIASSSRSVLVGGVRRLRDQVDKEVKDVGRHDRRNHVVLVERPPLALHGRRPGPPGEFLDEQLTGLGEHDRGLAGDHLHVIPGLLHDLLDPREGQRVRPGFSR